MMQMKAKVMKMRKLFMPIILIFRLVYKIIDKLFVTPVSRIIYKLSEFSKENSGKIEKILNRPNVLIYVSLISAIAMFLLVDSQVITLKETNAKIIADQKVEVTYNKEAYVVEGIPESVDITLIGSKSAIYLSTQLGEHKVEMDLSNYGVGTYKVPLKYNYSGQAIDYKLDPPTVNVKISEKVSVVKPLAYELTNQDKLDSKLSVSNIKLETSEIIIKSSQEILDKVAIVKALVDASQISLKESGDYTIDSVMLVAYDGLGEKIQNIEMVPSKVSATVTIDSYHAKKPVSIVTTGEMKNGKAIESISSSVTEVDVYGEKSVVDNITMIEASVDISSIEANKTVSVNLAKPTGVRYISNSTTNVTINVGNEAQKTISNIRVEARGLGENMTSQVGSNNEKFVDVIIKGVEAVINDDKVTKSVSVYVDLTGLKAGTHTVPIQVVSGDPRVSVQSVTTEITVRLYN